MIIYLPGESMERGIDYLSAIAEETNVSLNHIKRYYDILTRIPCVRNGDLNQSLNCLYYLILLKKNNEETKYEFRYLLDDALYKTYKDSSIPDLSLYYIAINDLDLKESLKQLKREI